MLGIDWLEATIVNRIFLQVLFSLRKRKFRSVVAHATRRFGVLCTLRLAWTAYKRDVNNTEWALDPRQVCHGVMVARSLLPRVESKTFVRAISLSDEPETFFGGVDTKTNTAHTLGSVWPAEVVCCGSH